MKALRTNPSVEPLWKNLTAIARRDFITWVEGAKQLETRKRRIEIARSKLLKGDKRPCCYAVVPMNLYKALGEHPKAKATWKDLSPTEKRDFVAWVEEADDKQAKAIKVNKVCALLASGKRRA